MVGKVRKFWYTHGMIISAATVLELCRTIKLIEGLSERELNNPEGVGVDLRVGEIHRLKSGGMLGVENRKTPEIELAAGLSRGDKSLIIQPGEYVLAKTMEKVNLPGEKIAVLPGREPVYLAMHTYPRSTLHRSGILFGASKTDPGYSGELVFSLFNASQFPFEIELGARFANVVFHEAVGELARAYEGQWQGGRVTTEGHEKQN